MYKILALKCLITAYSLSVQYLDGIKFGDYQVTITGMLMSVCFLCISRAKVLDSILPAAIRLLTLDPLSACREAVEGAPAREHFQPLRAPFGAATVRTTHRHLGLYHPAVVYI